mmetsp:Transcript_138676/g.386731  ORF Transcript_138676/g.386731 Transcript_138676/m.386731 type:complete len:310 (+) Transcript_138676:97-1026(+)
MDSAGGESRAAAAVEPVAERTVESAEAELDVDSLSSEWECPVCYQLYCEPVLAGCGRHTFCRNCLLRSQRYGASPKCPICRAESRVDAADLPEVTELVERLRARDPRYDERAAAARQEREERLQSRMLRTVSGHETWNGRTFEVCGAGSADVNGSYVAGVLPTYVGPTVYRKPNTYLFIYRWHQTQWVIAELRGPYSMGNEREWLYCAPTQPPNDIPPIHGWEVQARGRASSPAPEVHPVHTASPQQAQQHGSPGLRRRERLPSAGRPPAASSGPPAAGAGHDDAPWPSSVLDDDAQTRCRCAPSCCVQ